MYVKNSFCLSVFIYCLTIACAVSAQQPASDLVNKVKSKIESVNNYTADGRMKTNISFLKVPESDVKIYFKRPDKIRIVNEKGISLVPKGAVSITMNTILNNDGFTALDAGNAVLNNTPVRVIKMVPDGDKSSIILSTLYIDEKNLLVLKAKTTTRDNGTYELEMVFGKYASYALPDKILFVFNTKEYKLPKGVTFDYDDGSDKKKKTDSVDQNKGKVEIFYRSYLINKGVSDDIFK